MVLLVIPVQTSLATDLVIGRVIFSIEGSSPYLRYWGLVAKAWKEITGIQPTLFVISDKNYPVPGVDGDVYHVDPIPGVPNSFHAQVLKLLVPCVCVNEVCLVADFDLLPLQREYFEKIVENVSEDHFILCRDGLFDTDYRKEYPVCYSLGLGKTFADIFKAYDKEQINQKIKEWYALHLGKTVDQKMLYKALNEWDAATQKLIKLGHGADLRIDCLDWESNPIDLKGSSYVDMRLPFPSEQTRVSVYNTALALNLGHASIKGRSFSDANYGSHMVPLLTAVAHTQGPILELGAGDFSTPLLHAVCAPEKRLLVSTDTDKAWLDYFYDLETEWHQFIYVPVYGDRMQNYNEKRGLHTEKDEDKENACPELWDTIGNDVHWSVVLVDHRPGERRIEDIKRLRAHTDIFVIHDTQQLDYKYGPVIRSFKYRYKYDRYKITTTLVSDTVDVAALFKE